MKKTSPNTQCVVQMLSRSAKRFGAGGSISDQSADKALAIRRRLLSVFSAGLICLMLFLFEFPTAAVRDKSRRNPARENFGTSCTTGGCPEARTVQEASLAEKFGKLPLSFEANKGQTNFQAKFISRGPGYTLFLTSSGAVLSLRHKSNEQGPDDADDVLRMKWVGANSRAEIDGVDELAGRSNYFIGQNPKKWHVNVPNYGKVQYKNIYPGMDLVYYGNQRQLENDFVLAPGSDARSIAFSFSGASNISIGQEGDLRIETAGGEIQFRRPFAYQDIDGSLREVEARYEMRDAQHSIVGFDVGAYDHKTPLVIDPVLVYSTYLGGNSQDNAFGVVIDSSGSAYVVGGTSSPNFPSLNANQTLHGGRDAFISKFTPAGSSLSYSTFLGGTSDSSEYGLDIAVDNSGNAFVTGITATTDFPVMNAAQSSIGGGTGAQPDAFLARLNPSGGLAYSTYLGGPNSDNAQGVATDGAGNAYVTGVAGAGFPVTINAFLSTGLGFVAKLNTNASGAASLVYSSYLASTGTFTQGRGIAADSTGNAYVAGTTNSTNISTSGAAQASPGGSFDAFVTKFNTNLSGASSRVYSTYLGGGGADRAGVNGSLTASKAIAIDADGNSYITGSTDSTNFPTVNPFQNAKTGSTNAFLTKLNATGSSFIYSTYLGGNGSDEGRAVAVNVVGNAYVTGSAGSNFPVLASLSTTGGIFVTKFTPNGDALVYSTRLGGGNDSGSGVGLDGAGNAFVTGTTTFATFPTVNAFQAVGGGGADAFVSEIADPTIIGRVVDEDSKPIAGATVNLTGSPAGTTTTDANGHFTFGLLTVGNNYTVSVTVPNYIFASQNVNNLQKNVSLDFSPLVVSISGQVTLGSGGLDAVTMTLTNGKSLSTQTNGTGNYSFPNLPAGRNYTVTPAKAGFGFLPISSSFTNVLSNQIANFVAAATIQFNVGSYVANEADGKATITITRTSGASGPASVRYAISDGTAKQYQDYTLAFGTLRMAAGETSKDFQVLIVDDDYVEGDEFFFVTLSDPVGATIGTPNPAMVTITDNDTVPPTTNPIDQTRFFVQQHYYDFLSRYPDSSGWDFWTNNINNCTPQPSCTDVQRISTSGAYFLSIEFQQTGYLVERIHKVSFGDGTGTSTFNGTHQIPVPIVRFMPFVSDTEEIGDSLVVGQPGWEAVLEDNKQSFTLDFVQRSAFTSVFQTSMTPAQFVDKLFTNAGITPSSSDRQTAINEFSGAADTTNVTARSRALRDVAENSILQQQEFNRAFVLMQYFGYLRRNPNDAPDADHTGFDFWLSKLNQFNGDFVAAEMVKAFITSAEYRRRFGPS